MSVRELDGFAVVEIYKGYAGALPWPIYNERDVKVYMRTFKDNVSQELKLIESFRYEVKKRDQIVGGVYATVTMKDDWAPDLPDGETYKLYAVRDTARDQRTDFTRVSIGSNSYSDMLNKALDKLTLQTQELANRSLSLSVDDMKNRDVDATLPPLKGNNGKALVVKSDGGGFEFKDAGDSATAMIPNKYYFNSENERDNYFKDHPEELKEGLLIAIPGSNGFIIERCEYSEKAGWDWIKQEAGGGDSYWKITREGILQNKDEGIYGVSNNVSTDHYKADFICLALQDLSFISFLTQERDGLDMGHSKSGEIYIINGDIFINCEEIIKGLSKKNISLTINISGIFIEKSGSESDVSFELLERLDSIEKRITDLDAKFEDELYKAEIRLKEVMEELLQEYSEQIPTADDDSPISIDQYTKKMTIKHDDTLSVIDEGLLHVNT